MPLLLLTLVLQLSIVDDAEYQAGEALYESLEYEQANFRFQKLLLRSDITDADRAQLTLWGGLCYAGTGEMQSARAAFDLAFALDPDAELPLDAVAPAVVDLADRAREDAQRNAAERAAIETPPRDAATPETGDADPAPAEESGLSPSIVAMAIGGVLLVGAALIFVGSASTAALGGTLFLNARALASNDNNDARDVNDLVSEANNLLIASGLCAAIALGFGATGGAVVAAGVVLPEAFRE